jgi:hypothetical protein
MKLQLLVFAVAFAQLALISLNTLNIVRQRVLPAVLTSLCITATWAFNVNIITTDPKEVIVAYGLGCAAGTATLITLDKRRRKHDPDGPNS